MEERKTKTLRLEVPEEIYWKTKEAGKDFGLTAPAFAKMVLVKTLKISDIFSDFGDKKKIRQILKEK